MPKFDPVQTNFTAGELSPRLLGNFQIDKYKQGLNKLENMFAQPHGGVSRRGGSKYVAEVKTSAKITILHSFKYKDEFSYILEFGDQYIRFYRNQAQILDGASAYEVATTYLEAELRDLRFAQDEETLYIVHKNHLPAQLTRVNHDDWTLADISFSYDGVATVDTIVEPAIEVWTAQRSSADNPWADICWSPELELFVAVSAGGTNSVMTSPDGVTWTTRVPPDDNSWYAVCWSPDLALFAVVSYAGTANRVMTSPDGITWTARAATTTLWTDICWSPELSIFCAVASIGADRVMTSPDGVTWTDQDDAVSDANAWQSICWSEELSLFVAVSSDGANRVMTSPDGETWTARAHDGANEWNSVCWSPELTLFVAVSVDDDASGQVMTSPDGTNWTQQTTPTELQWWEVCWAAEIGLFCAVAIDGTGNGVMTSADGVTWTTQIPANDRNWFSVCWSPELAIFCAVAGTGTGDRAMTGYYGMVNGTYTLVPLTEGTGTGCIATVIVANNTIDSITITTAGTLYIINDTLSIAAADIGGSVAPVACDVATLTAGDIPSEWQLANWTGRTAAEANSWQKICWSSKLKLFCAVATGGTSRVMTSPDGITWTGRTAAEANQWQNICWSEKLSLFCAVSNTGTNRIMTSPDGVTWTAVASPNAYAWTSVCWSHDLSLFCAVSSDGVVNGQVMTSPDGVIWTSRTSAEENQWRSVCWSSYLSLFCAVSLDGTTRVMTSPDGITWTAKAAAEANSWWSVCWSPELSLFCAVASTGTNRVMTSPDGATWTARVAAAANSWYDICWSPEQKAFVAVSIDGTYRVMSSFDGVNWVAIEAAEATTWLGICWSPDLLLFAAVAAGGTDRVMTSKYALINCPTLCWFFEQRFWFASTPNEPNQVWGSRIADYNNLYIGIGLATDAIDILIKEATKLLWATTSEVVLLGSNNGVFRLSANNLNEAITPTNIRAPKVVSYGSAFLPAIDVDGNPLFIQRGLRKVRRLEYDDRQDRYKAADIAILSEHITESGIIDVAYSDEPSSFIWGVRTDGELICMTYEPEYGVFGWSRHILGGTDMLVKSVAVSDAVTADEDEVWVIVSRTIDGSTVQYVEFLTQGLTPEDVLADAFFVDGGVTKTGSAFTTFDGLTHLIGETVQVFGDGLVQVSKVVSGAGEITITAADKAHAGLQCTAILETLPMEGGNPVGSAHGKIKRIASVVLRLYKSLTFTIGDLLGNSTEDVDLGASLYTDDTEKLDFHGEYETGGQIKIQITDPVPFTLLAIMYEARTEE